MSVSSSLPALDSCWGVGAPRGEVGGGRGVLVFGTGFGARSSLGSPGVLLPASPQVVPLIPVVSASLPLALALLEVSVLWSRGSLLWAPSRPAILV